MLFDPRIFLGLVLAVSSWLTPQPRLSSGLLVLYGGPQLVQANASWHSYVLKPTNGCGIASISPAHLGRLAYVSVDRHTWIGPCLVVDVQGRNDALDSIYRRKEVAEVDKQTAATLGFIHGAQGYVFFGACPPDASIAAYPYHPPLVYDAPPTDWTPSMFPYPKQQLPQQCKPNRYELP